MHSFLNLQIRRVFRVPNYVRAFGLWHGLRLLMLVERSLSRQAQTVRPYRLPGYPAPIHLRESVSDHATFWQCLVMQQYDIRAFPQAEHLTRAYRAMLSRNEQPVILDAGGNIGLAAVWFAMAFPDALTISVEPDRRNFEMLTKNTAIFGNRVKVVLGAVAERQKRMRIVNPTAGSSALRVEESNNGSPEDVEARTVDDLVGSSRGGSIFVVKLDIEGGQDYLFASNLDWIARVHLIILELDDWQFPWQATSKNFFKALSQYDFDYVVSGESIFCFRHARI